MNKLIVALTLGLIALPAQAQVRTDWHALCPSAGKMAEVYMAKRQAGEPFEEARKWGTELFDTKQGEAFRLTTLLEAYNHPQVDDPDERRRIIAEFGAEQTERCRSWDPL